MDYEQKYKEALAWAEEQLKGAKVFDYKEEQIAHDIRQTVYSIFPELAESEKYDGQMDKECIELCDTLNKLPSLRTFESCCGHLKSRYSIWFSCDNIDTISRLGRCVDKNYSDGKLEIVVDSTDVHPKGNFWLRSKEAFKTYDEMNDSIRCFMDSILHWFKKDFDSYFNDEQKNEDEKIRKNILSFAEGMLKNNISDTQKEKFASWIDWLEKQKEPKDDTVGTFSYGSERPSQLDLVHAINQTKEFLKQKPVEWSKNDEYYHSIISYCLDGKAIGGIDKENAINWLKSLKDRALPQPKQEWSEKDEEIIDYIIDVLGEATIAEENFTKCRNWLKSLRPQKQWKPSEEQLDVLNDACDGLEYNKQVLYELYKQLKAL